MINIHPSENRGTTTRNWLDSKHSFSFGDYYDPENLGFGPLRVINEDIITAKKGFPPHPHQNMEIITYILEGALEHKDSLGNGSIIMPGDLQRMTAGTGIVHSEFNPLNQNTHLLQIWITPNKQNLPPSYEQKNFTSLRTSGNLTLLASNDGRNQSLTINQALNLYVLDLEKTFTFNNAKKIWLQIAQGTIKINDKIMKQGDGASVTNEVNLKFTALEKSEILIFELNK